MDPLASVAKHPHFEKAARATHSRPALPVHAPAIVEHAVVMVGEADPATDHNRFLEAVAKIGWEVIQEEGSEIVAVQGRNALKWERHTEFLTLTAVASDAEPESATLQAFVRVLASVAGASRDDADDPKEAGERGLLARTRIHVRKADDGAAPAGLDRAPIRALVNNDLVTVSATLRHDAHGMIVYDAQLNQLDEQLMSPGRVGRFVQRLIEVEAYRLLAYLAVPMMQSMGAQVAELEASVNAIAKRASLDPGPEEEAAILTELTNLSAELQSAGSASEFRFAASLAYSAIVDERLEAMREKRVEGYQRLSNAIKRRLDPAMRSCKALLARQQKIADRINHITDLLRTRVDLALQDQNARVLRSIDDRAKAQLRLQQAVEGLSVAAIAYYTLGIIYYLVKGTPPEWVAIPKDSLQALFVIPVALLVYFGLRRVRARSEKEDDL